MLPELSAYYARGGEDARIIHGRNRLELLRTREVLSRVLPDPPARVLDVGGASGVHALWLVEAGYDVHLVDPVALHIRQARQRGLNAVVGDARRLDAAGESFDVVLLLGPLYHLVQREDRLRALTEAGRVLRPGGIAAAAAISRFAPVRDGLARDFFADHRFDGIVERDIRDGQHRNADAQPGWFTTAYFHHPHELGEEVTGAGLRMDKLVAVEGVGHWMTDVDEILDDPRRRADLLRWLEALESESSMLGASGHLLALATRVHESMV